MHGWIIDEELPLCPFTPSHRRVVPNASRSKQARARTAREQAQVANALRRRTAVARAVVATSKCVSLPRRVLPNARCLFVCEVVALNLQTQARVRVRLACNQLSLASIGAKHACKGAFF